MISLIHLRTKRTLIRFRSEAKLFRMPLTNASPAPVVSTDATLTPATLPLNSYTDFQFMSFFLQQINKIQHKRKPNNLKPLVNASAVILPQEANHHSSSLPDDSYIIQYHLPQCNICIPLTLQLQPKAYNQDEKASSIPHYHQNDLHHQSGM